MKRILLFLFVCLAGHRAHAIAPNHQTDYELAQYPHIVLAQWEKAEMRPHKKVRGNVLEEFEVFTELNVLRVIKGDLKPGRHTLHFGYGIGWKEDGTGLRTWTSTDLLGDVDNVTEPRIWLLTRSRSWDDSDETDYLHVPHYRYLAAVVYAELSGESGADFIRTLLSDRDPKVRAVAVGVLIRAKDEESLPKLAPAIQGLSDTHLACEIIREAASWGDKGVVPLLISFLQDDSSSGRIGRDVRIPAVKAREAIHGIAGCWFPFSTRQSHGAWTKVSSLAGLEQKRQRLRDIIPFERCPLEAEFYGPLPDSHIRVVNVSKRHVTISRYPAWVDANTARMVASAGTDYRELDGKGDFVTLDAGAATVFRPSFAGHFKGVDPKALTLSLFYRDLPTDAEKTGWIGWVGVRRMEGTLEETRDGQQDKQHR